MSGSGNLRVPSSAEARENGRKGGIASGEARRKKKLMREVLEELLADTYTDKDGRTVDGTTMLMLASIAKAQKGDMRAMEFIRDTIGEKPQERVEVSTEDSAKFNELLEQLEAE